MGEAEFAVVRRAQAREAVVGAERVAAGGDEIDDAVERAAVECGVGEGGTHLGEQIVGRKRRRTRHAENVLGEHVEGAGPVDDGVLLAGGRGLEGGAAFEDFEPVGGHEQGF